MKLLCEQQVIALHAKSDLVRIYVIRYIWRIESILVGFSFI